MNGTDSRIGSNLIGKKFKKHTINITPICICKNGGRSRNGNLRLHRRASFFETPTTVTPNKSLNIFKSFNHYQNTAAAAVYVSALSNVRAVSAMRPRVGNVKYRTSRRASPRK